MQKVFVSDNLSVGLRLTRNRSILVHWGVVVNSDRAFDLPVRLRADKSRCHSIDVVDVVDAVELEVAVEVSVAGAPHTPGVRLDVKTEVEVVAVGARKEVQLGVLREGQVLVGLRNLLDLRHDLDWLRSSSFLGEALVKADCAARAYWVLIAQSAAGPRAWHRCRLACRGHKAGNQKG